MFGLFVYENNGVCSIDKLKVVCKLCNVYLKYNGNIMNMQKYIDRYYMFVLFLFCFVISDIDSEVEKVKIDVLQ